MWPCGVLRMSHENCIFREDMAKWKKISARFLFGETSRRKLCFQYCFDMKRKKLRFVEGDELYSSLFRIWDQLRHIYKYRKEIMINTSLMIKKKTKLKDMPWIPNCLPIFTILEIWIGLPGPRQISRAYTCLCGRKKVLVITSRQFSEKTPERINLPPVSQPTHQTSCKPANSVKGQLSAISGCTLCSGYLAPQLWKQREYDIRNRGGCCALLLELPELGTAEGWVVP